ncbi:MAG TPA: HAD family phosphatase [Tepidisphaeraceae bacterium]|jgi:HAD superfamily hydrolase (TIGR01509 family)|nr:HAD family phosphatase [Tepidisphaeraceae bacterium]
MQAVIFDMDGLMIDSEGIYWAVARQMAREFGKEVSDDTLGRMMGRAPLESVELYARELGLNRPPEQLMRERDQRVLEIFQGGIEPMPGLMQVVEDLRPRFKMAVATSARLSFVNIIFGGLGIHRFFDIIQTSDDIHRGKPDPEIYLLAMSKLGVGPQDCFVLEDSSNGSLAGKRAGAYSIAVPSQYTRKQDFSFADYVARDLLDANAHIDAIARQRNVYGPK